MIPALYEWFLFLGALLIFIASLGILRMPDLFLRMHACAKAGTLGAGLMLLGVRLFFSSWYVAIELTVAILFLMFTAPVAFHLIGRIAYRSDIKLDSRTKNLT